jgi:hypothetical protein
VLTITVVARSVEDIGLLMDRLKRTGAFLHPGESIEERANEEGQIQATMDVEYVPESGHATGRDAGGGRR